MNQPWVYMCPEHILNPLPTSLPSHPSGSSQCTSPEHPISCIEPGLAICFTYDNIPVSMPFSQIIHPHLLPQKTSFKGGSDYRWDSNRAGSTRKLFIVNHTITPELGQGLGLVWREGMHQNWPGVRGGGEQAKTDFQALPRRPRPSRLKEGPKTLNI